MAAFDENNEVIDWNLFKGKTNKNGEWVKVQSDDNTSYVLRWYYLTHEILVKLFYSKII